MKVICPGRGNCILYLKISLQKGIPHNRDLLKGIDYILHLGKKNKNTD